MRAFPKFRRTTPKPVFAVPQRGILPSGIIFDPPALSLPSAANGRVEQIGDLKIWVPQSPSAVLNHTVPGMVTSPLTNRECRRNRAGMWPSYHKAREKRLDSFSRAPLDKADSQP